MVFPWIVAAFLAGFAVSHFRNEIIEWANRILGYFVDVMNKATEVASDAIVSLVKQGSRHFYKEIKTWVKNIYNNSIREEYRQEPVPNSEIPADIKAQLDQRSAIKLMQMQTQN